MKKTFKTAIIGGGICGLYLAWKLAERGEKVLVFEKEREAGVNKACSGLFSERILGFVPESEKLIENTIDKVFINFPKKRTQVKFSKKFFVMNHSNLDKLVFKLAEKAGANILFSHNVKSIPQGFDRVIGCDGANSFTRKKLGLPDNKVRLGILGFKEEKAKENSVEVWPVEKNGFIWNIPRGERREYGIVSDPKTASSKFDNFLEENCISLKDKDARMVPQSFALPSNKKITLCGDSAGLTKPWSGGGVVWGLILANILLKTFPDFLKYKREAKKFFGSKLLFSKTATSLVYFLGFRAPWLLPSENKMESDFLR